METPKKTFSSLKEFYPYYLSEHQNPTSRKLHFIGTAFLFFILGAAIFFSKYILLLFIPIVGYGFAWVGHFFFEKNKPATFKHPFYSLASDFILFYHLASGKEKFNP
ncbi:DUF962 domain-containing protein [Aquiflexum sp. LQ15W]|uniref:Mpo1-like protein n=1 Tax=Cognataquiflexum nitidum TaxID=2922272 RepID=UPI001F1293D5|nr:DUF962 domain-containing protein [Cognataquiflexum nitidum]MCH6198964.1 DUF962 domain-containing protein [Cognataquiflexum nitidum]